MLVAGWFSFELMGASAGDLLARDLVIAWLHEAGIAHDVAVAAPFSDGIDWRTTDPAAYTHVIFVCGPFGNGPPVDLFIEHFAGSRLIGINLTMLQPLEEWNPFETLIERDSSRTERPDLVLLSNAPRVPVVGLVLIDAQPEYAADKRVDVEAVIRGLIADNPMAVVDIDTRLDVNRHGLRTAAEVESLIARMDVVITTRLHGTVLAVKHGVPVIAIDAVAGGAKIARQVRALGWPIAFGAEDLTPAALRQAFAFCLTSEARALARRCRRDAVTRLSSVKRQFLDALRDA
ncbi:MAG: polysaccharide pyruvyl transferase family protein [Gemmatimonadaceae bacterium]|nr:polysaccharide pyruvyl transferase family protein [Gemmatimonadaceae bacterium]